MKKFLGVVVLIAVLVAGCAKAKNPLSPAIATSVPTVAVATSTPTSVPPGSTPTATATITSTVTSTATLVDTPIPSPTQVTMVYVGMTMEDLGGNTSETANLSVNCGGYAMSQTEALQYQYFFTTYSDQVFSANVTPGTIGGVVEFDVYLSDNLANLYDDDNCAYVYTNDPTSTTPPGGEIFCNFPINNYY